MVKFLQMVNKELINNHILSKIKYLRIEVNLQNSIFPLENNPLYSSCSPKLKYGAGVDGET